MKNKKEESKASIKIPLFLMVLPILGGILVPSLSAITGTNINLSNVYSLLIAVSLLSNIAIPLCFPIGIILLIQSMKNDKTKTDLMAPLLLIILPIIGVLLPLSLLLNSKVFLLGTFIVPLFITILCSAIAIFPCLSIGIVFLVRRLRARQYIRANSS